MVKKINTVTPTKKQMFLAMRDIFFGGEFSHWIKKKKMPLAAFKEYEEAKDYFEKCTGFDCKWESEK